MTTQNTASLAMLDADIPEHRQAIDKTLALLDRAGILIAMARFARFKRNPETEAIKSLIMDAIKPRVEWLATWLTNDHVIPNHRGIGKEKSCCSVLEGMLNDLEGMLKNAY
jgi:hypothetical protein